MITEVKCDRENNRIGYEVKNTGNAPASVTHETALLVKFDGGWEQMCRDSVGVDLQPEDSYVGWFACYSWLECKTLEVRVCADRYNTIEESNEANNCLEDSCYCELASCPTGCECLSKMEGYKGNLDFCKDAKGNLIACEVIDAEHGEYKYCFETKEECHYDYQENECVGPCPEGQICHLNTIYQDSEGKVTYAQCTCKAPGEDATLPTYSIIETPAEPKLGDMVEIEVTASDPSGIGMIQIWLDGEQKKVCHYQSNNDESCTHTLPRKWPRWGQLGIIVCDKGGNCACEGEIPNIWSILGMGDKNGDGVRDSLDNCVDTPNPDQRDGDQDGVGDECDECDAYVVCRDCGDWRNLVVDDCRGLRWPDYEFVTIYHEVFYDLVSENGCGCKDSDGSGSAYFEKGGISTENMDSLCIPFPSWMERPSVCESISECGEFAEDICIDPSTGEPAQSSSHLKEYGCTVQGPRGTVVECPYGCADGACNCPDSDGGMDFHNRGTIEGNTDYCIDSSHLREYHCVLAEGGIGYTDIECPVGCQNGACICEDSDGGRNYDVQGVIGTYEDHCTGEQELVEYWVTMEDGTCILHSETIQCNGLCQDGECLQATCDDGIRNYHDGRMEEDIDCGGPCSECGYVRISGYLQYEKEYDEYDPGLDAMILGLRAFRPIREGKVELRGCYSETTYTDSSGYFEFVVPREEGEEFYIKLKAHNYAARVEKDFDACNEYAWWESDRMVTPASGDLDRGDLMVGIDTDLDFTGYWKEGRHTCIPFTDICACGGNRHNNNGGSAYFNIADTILVGRTYAEMPINRVDNDSIGRVDVAFPDPTHTGGAWQNPFFDEIYLPEGYGFLDATILHEYAHHLSEELSENDWALADHDVCDRITYGCAQTGPVLWTCFPLDPGEFAWFEGFANYFGRFLTNQYRTGPNCLSQEDTQYEVFEDIYQECTVVGCEREGGIMAVLWDLVDEFGSSDYPDSEDEHFDHLNGYDATIFRIFDGPLQNVVDAPDMGEFVSAWKSQYHGDPEAELIDDILEEYGCLD